LRGGRRLDGRRAFGGWLFGVVFIFTMDFS
jgi:hypothetical protein